MQHASPLAHFNFHSYSFQARRVKLGILEQYRRLLVTYKRPPEGAISKTARETRANPT